MTLSATGSISRQKASYRDFSASKTQPYYSWYAMYDFKGLDLQCYLSSSLHSQYNVTPQSVGWERYDGYSLSFMKFLNKGKIQLMLMWSMPIHFMKRDYESILTSTPYTERQHPNNYRMGDNSLVFDFVWRFNGGKKTRSYDRQTESVEIK